MAWIYLFAASLFEIAWTFSLKLLDFKKIWRADWSIFFSKREDFFLLLPLLGYIVFGTGNIYFFSLAMKNIPAATAMAVWLGTALIGVKIIDTAYFKEPFYLSQVFYFLLILAGVIGLQKSS